MNKDQKKLLASMLVFVGVKIVLFTSIAYATRKARAMMIEYECPIEGYRGGYALPVATGDDGAITGHSETN